MADSCYTRQIAAPSCRHPTRHTVKSNVCNVKTCTFYTDKWSRNAWNFFYFPSKFPLTSSETNATQTLQFWRPMAISWYSPYWKKKWIEFQIQIYRRIPKTILSLSLQKKSKSKNKARGPLVWLLFRETVSINKHISAMLWFYHNFDEGRNKKPTGLKVTWVSETLQLHLVREGLIFAYQQPIIE